MMDSPNKYCANYIKGDINIPVIIPTANSLDFITHYIRLKLNRHMTKDCFIPPFSCTAEGATHSVTHTWTRATVRMCSFNLLSIKASVSQRETGVCMCVFMWGCDKREAMFRAGPAPLLTRNHAIILSLPILHWCLETHSPHTHTNTSRYNTNMQLYMLVESIHSDEAQIFGITTAPPSGTYL